MRIRADVGSHVVGIEFDGSPCNAYDGCRCSRCNRHRHRLSVRTTTDGGGEGLGSGRIHGCAFFPRRAISFGWFCSSFGAPVAACTNAAIATGRACAAGGHIRAVWFGTSRTWAGLRGLNVAITISGTLRCDLLRRFLSSARRCCGFNSSNLSSPAQSCKTHTMKRTR